jgi:hypothetical protein
MSFVRYKSTLSEPRRQLKGRRLDFGSLLHMLRHAQGIGPMSNKTCEVFNG